MDGRLRAAVEAGSLGHGDGREGVVHVALVTVAVVATVPIRGPLLMQVEGEAAERGTGASAKQGHPGGGRGSGEAGRLNPQQQTTQVPQQRGGVVGLLVLLNLLQVGLELHLLLWHAGEINREAQMRSIEMHR